MNQGPDHHTTQGEHPVATWGIILAGGRGSRIRDLYPDIPKPMIPCLGIPFLGWVLAYLRAQGVHRSVVSLGHLADVATRWLAMYESDSARVVVEQTPLGTGGGIRLAWTHVPDTHASVLVTNGDSLVLADLAGAFSAMQRPDIDGIVVGVDVPDASRFGSLDVGDDGLLRGFREKRPGRGLINAGIYLLKPTLKGDLGHEASVLSMEQDVFPTMLAQGRRLHVHPTNAPFIDIGTPESVGQAEDFLRTHADAFAPLGLSGARPVSHGGLA